MTDFTVGPYSIRFSNPNVSPRDDNRYSKLNSVGKYDAFVLFRSFMSSNVANFSNIKETKTVFRFQDLIFDDKKRKISGRICVGNYGSLNDIIDTDSGNVDFEKTTRHAEIVKYYFCFYVPVNADEGVVLIQSIRGNGVKTLLHSILREYVDRTCKHNLQMNPLAYEGGFDAWKEAVTRDITLVRFNPVKDLADKIQKLGHDELPMKLVIQMSKVRTKLIDFYTPDSDAANVVEMLRPDCDRVQATFVGGDGRTKTFNISSSASHPICEIDVPDDVEVLDGNVVLESMRNWCDGVLDDFAHKIIKP